MRMLLALSLVLTTSCASGWVRTETEHLVVHARPGSYAAEHIEEAAARYEELARGVFEDVPVEPRRFRVFLHEELRGGTTIGWVTPLTGSLNYVYSENVWLVSQHEMLHVALDDLNGSAPGRIEEGTCRSFEAREDGGEWVSLARYATLAPDDALDVRTILTRGYDGDHEGNGAAAFVRFLRERIGDEAYWQLYRDLDRRDPVGQVAARLGLAREQLQPEFRSYVDALEPPPGTR